MRLNQFTLPVTNIKTSQAFYTQLGFRLIVDTDHYCRFSDPNGHGTLSIKLATGQPPPSSGTLYIEYESPDKLNEAVADLKASGVDITTPEDKRWLWREAHLTDPDNHTIILYFAGDNRLNPPWRVE